MAREPYVDLFKGTKVTTFHLPLLEETMRQARALINENDWPEQEGLQIIFANGLCYLQGQKRLDGLAGHDADLAAEAKRLTVELMVMHSKYAVMKFRAFTLEQAKQTLDFNVVGLERENLWSAARLKKFREDEELLRAELRAVGAERDALRQRLASPEAPAAAQEAFAHRGLLAAVFRLVRR